MNAPSYIPPVKTLQTIPVTDIIPVSWVGWVWSLLSEGSPFSYGDTNHTLVVACDFADHLEDVLDMEDSVDTEESKQVFAILEYMDKNEILVDIEN